MKWLFAILVALNIIVFAGTLTYRLSERQLESERLASEHTSRTARELGVPNIALQPSASGAPEWVQASAPQVLTEDAALAAMQELDKTDEQKAQEKAAKEKEAKERLAKQKKEKEAKERLAQQQQTNQESERAELTRLARENGLLPPDATIGAIKNSPAKSPAPAATKGSQCSYTGRVSIPEDDYHRLKGLLNHWPNSVNRTVAPRGDNRATTTVTQYQVWVAVSGDVEAQQAELIQKGFQGALMGNRFSIGSFKSKSAAQALLAKMNQSGISGGSITEKAEQTAANDNSLSMAKIDVFFTSLSEQDFTEVQQVVGKYGRLQRGVCR